VFGWGRNDYGQLGTGSKKDQTLMEPQLIKPLMDKKIIMTASGDNHSLFLSD
jgi:alpha-tubulin suppressor-like RCC1 family protein